MISKNYLIAGVLVFSTALARAESIDVLWYSYSDPTSNYLSILNDFSTNTVQTFDDASGLAWNLTLWDPGSSAPLFSNYDVLVIQGGEATALTGSTTGGPLRATPDFSGILANSSTISAARGERTLISGSDADIHALRNGGDTGNDSPANADRFDGARGYLVNAVNWAGSGEGLGIVSFVHGYFPESLWWFDENSFLRDELSGWMVAENIKDNSPLITLSEAAYPLNSGLTSLGLSGWINSFHARFDAATPGYTPTVVDANGNALSLATTAYVNAATAPVPLPPAWMLLAGAAALLRRGGVRRRRAGLRPTITHHSFGVCRWTLHVKYG